MASTKPLQKDTSFAAEQLRMDKEKKKRGVGRNAPDINLPIRGLLAPGQNLVQQKGSLYVGVFHIVRVLGPFQTALVS